MDPAEWAAGLEDRFYDNHVFKDTKVTDCSTRYSIIIKINREFYFYVCLCNSVLV